MNPILTIRNRQRLQKIDLRLLRRILKSLLTEPRPAGAVELGIFIVGTAEMRRLNETFLRHQGPTDVITFDYSEAGGGPALHGEIFVCMDEALLQARRFRTTWPSEMVRYIIHGVLHLQGFDDSRSAARRKMKREENRLLRILARRFPLSKL